ncbi:hypothetical protein [Streptomyces griseorubiginosus]
MSEKQKWLVVRLDHGHGLTRPVLIRHLAPGSWIHPHPAIRLWWPAHA